MCPNQNTTKPADPAVLTGEREAFEKWAREYPRFKNAPSGIDVFKREVTWPDRFYYFWGMTESAWAAWQAASSQGTDAKELDALRACARNGLLKFCVTGEVGQFWDRIRNLIQGEDWNGLKNTCRDFFNYAQDRTEKGWIEIRHAHEQLDSTERQLAEVRKALTNLIARSKDAAHSMSICQTATFGCRPELSDCISEAERVLSAAGDATVAPEGK